MIFVIADSGQSKEIFYNTKTISENPSMDNIFTEKIESQCRYDCLDWSANEDGDYCSGGYGEVCKNVSISKSGIIILYSGLKNYYNGSEFVSINSTIENNSINIFNTNYNAYNEKGEYQVYYKEQSSSIVNEPVRFKTNNYTLTITPNSLKFLGQTNKHKKQSFLNIINNSGIYEGQFGDGIDLRYSYYNSILKKELIINSLQELKDSIKSTPNQDDILQLKFTIKGYEVGNESNLNNLKIGSDRINFNQDLTDVSTDQKIEFLDKNNNTIYYFPRPYIEDSNNSKMILNYTYDINRFSNLVIKVQVPYSWLSDESKVYPIIIDPSVSLDDAGGYLLDDAYTLCYAGSPGACDNAYGNNPITDDELLVGASGHPPYNITTTTWIKFDISDIATLRVGNITGYNLTLRVKNLAWNVDITDVFVNHTIFLGNDTWREKNITGDNAPPINLSVNSSTKYSWDDMVLEGEHDYNITEIFNENPNSDNLTLVVRAIEGEISDTTGFNYQKTIIFYSKENAIEDRGAKLKIIYEDFYNLTDCSDLDLEGATYYLDNDILDSQTDKCMRFTGDNIKLDCKGHKIYSDGEASDYGIYIEDNLENIEIFNCSLDNWDTYSIRGNGTTNLNISYVNVSTNTEGTLNNHGVYLTNINNAYIHNNIFQNNKGHGLSISADDSTFLNNTAYKNTYNGLSITGDNNLITNNSLYYNNMGGLKVQGNYHNINNNNFYNNTYNYLLNYHDGVYAYKLNNSNISDNNFYDNKHGITANSFHYNNIFDNNFYNNTEDNIRTWDEFGASNNNFYNNLINCSGGLYGIRLMNSVLVEDNLFYDMNITGSCSASITMEDGGTNNTFLNVSFINITISDGEIIRQWYLDVQVNDTLDTAIENASTEIYQINGSLSSSSNTSSAGYSRIRVTEYIQNTTNKYYQTPHIINVSSNKHNHTTTTFNFTLLENIEYGVILLSDIIYPQISVFNITTSRGSVNGIFNLISSDMNLELCKYSLFNSTSGIDGTNENVSFTCNSNPVAFTTSTLDIFNLTIYVSDYAGNENSSTLNFTSIALPTGGGEIPEQEKKK